MHSICHQIWKSQQWPQDWKRSVFIPIPKKVKAKECSYYHTIAFNSHASNIMLKNSPSQVSAIHDTWTCRCSTCFSKGRETRDQIANIYWIIEKAREFQKKTSISALLTAKPLTVQITTNCGKFLRRLEYRPPDLPLEKSVCRSGSNS